MRANLFKTRKPMPSSVSFYISEFLKDCHPTNAYICALVWYTETRACAFSALLARRSGQRPRNRTRLNARDRAVPTTGRLSSRWNWANTWLPCEIFHNLYLLHALPVPSQSKSHGCRLRGKAGGKEKKASRDEEGGKGRGSCANTTEQKEEAEQRNPLPGRPTEHLTPGE